MRNDAKDDPDDATGSLARKSERGGGRDGVTGGAGRCVVCTALNRAEQAAATCGQVDLCYMYIYLYIYVNVCRYMCICVYMHMCICVYMYICIHIYVGINI